MENLPTDSIHEILYNLNYIDIINFCMINTSYNKIINNENFWTILCHNKFDKPVLDYLLYMFNLKSNYKILYKNFYKVHNANYASIFLCNLKSQYIDKYININDDIPTFEELDIYTNTTLFRKYDMIEINDLSGYRSEGVFMIDIIDNEFKIVELNYEIDDYGSPNSNFKFGGNIINSDYWNYDKMNVFSTIINLNPITPSSYWHWKSPPIVLDKIINIDDTFKENNYLYIVSIINNIKYIIFNQQYDEYYSGYIHYNDDENISISYIMNNSNTTEQVQLDIHKKLNIDLKYSLCAYF